MPTPVEEFRKKLQPVSQRVRELEARLGDPALTQNPRELQKLTLEYRRATALLAKFRAYEVAAKELNDTEQILDQAEEQEMQELVEKELAALRTRVAEHDAGLTRALAPRSPDWDRNCIVELRPAAGGEESALFAADLYRMYTYYAEKHGLNVEVMNSRPSELKGFKEMIFAVSGEEPYRFFRFESGVHRVQRIPETEASGRIHTSTVTVAVLPEPEEVDITIDPADLRVDVFRASGHGGQHVNVTDSAVRVTHMPTGIVVSCQDERSQGRNKAKALKVLAARLLDAKRREEAARTAQNRRSQIGTGDRSEKIRTYNFPQNRLTDHRISLSLYSLDRVMEGGLDKLFQALENAEAEAQHP
jgi:peptide chain release factor 1